MKIEEFLCENTDEAKINEPSIGDEANEDVEVALDVQKAVVESLAADKAERDEHIVKLEKEKKDFAEELEKLKRELAETKKFLADAKEELNKAIDALSVEKENAYNSSNTVSILDRNFELPDRFVGETRDHVLEAVKNWRDCAEKDGRIRCAQLMEAVMVANEPSGELQKKRAALEKFFNDNQNILSGSVITELDKCGISYKNGEEYLLTSEIIRRTY